MIQLPAKYNRLNRYQKAMVKRQYIELQENKCWHCKGDLGVEPPEEVLKLQVKPYLYPKGFFDNPMHLQHDHVTGLTEGVVHAHCNAVLWEFFGR